MVYGPTIDRSFKKSRVISDFKRSLLEGDLKRGQLSTDNVYNPPGLCLFDDAIASHQTTNSRLPD